MKNLARLRAPGLTPRAIREKFSTLQMVDVHLPTTDGRHLVLPRRTHPTRDRQLLLDRVLGATLHAFPEGEDEAADAAMERRDGSTLRWLVSSSMAMPGQAALNEASLGTSHFSATASTETMRTRRGVVRWRSETPCTSARMRCTSFR